MYGAGGTWWAGGMGTGQVWSGGLIPPTVELKECYASIGTPLAVTQEDCVVL